MLSELDLHVTNRCTIQCDYCCFSSNRKQLVELSTDELKKVMSDAASMGCKESLDGWEEEYEQIRQNGGM